MLDPQHLRRGKSTEIVEIEAGSLGLIARLLHLHATRCDNQFEKELALTTIWQLAFQTSIVKVDIKAHFPAYLEPANMPKELQIIERV